MIPANCECWRKMCLTDVIVQVVANYHLANAARVIVLSQKMDFVAKTG